MKDLIDWITVIAAVAWLALIFGVAIVAGKAIRHGMGDDDSHDWSEGR